jgi:hypothetical protein
MDTLIADTSPGAGGAAGAAHDVAARDVIAEALAIIDKSLGTLVRRELVSSSEMTDLLLDVRSILADSSAN